MCWSNAMKAMDICPQKATEIFQVQASPSSRKPSITRFILLFCGHRDHFLVRVMQGGS